MKTEIKPYPNPTGTYPKKLELEARKLRDSIYGKGTDTNWESCKLYWLEYDMKFLRNKGQLN